MKGLSGFQTFDWIAFAKDKLFTVTSVGEWRDYNTKELLGTKVNVIISQDNTKYEFKDGKVFSNMYAQLSFKTPKNLNGSVTVGSNVIPVNPTCTVYGQYRENLSVKCVDIQTVKPVSTN